MIASAAGRARAATVQGHGGARSSVSRAERRGHGRDLRPGSLAIAGLALLGLVTSSYLAAYQLGVVASVWDPLFGHGSERVLTSTVSRLLPVPDATLGAAAYATDAVLSLVLVARVAAVRAVATVLALVATGGAVVAVVLVYLQPLVAGSFCSLCLVSAVLSVLVAVGAVSELRDVVSPLGVTGPVAGPAPGHRPSTRPEGGTT